MTQRPIYPDINVIVTFDFCYVRSVALIIAVCALWINADQGDSKAKVFYTNTRHNTNKQMLNPCRA